MSTTQRRAALSLICVWGAFSLVNLPESHGGIWDKITLTSANKTAASAAPTKTQLQSFFTDDGGEPDAFRTIGNEVSIEAPPVPADVSPAPPAALSPVPDPANDHAREHSDFCTTGCHNGFHSWWCRHQQWWACQSELSRERRLKNSRNLFKKSYYETFPPYHVENYGIYRTCWRKLPDLDCCPEDVVEPDLVPPPTHSHK